MSIAIPTSARGAIRAFIKGHADFQSWASAQGIVSREATNAQLLEFAGKYGLMNDVLQIIAQQPGGAAAIAARQARRSRTPNHTGDADKEFFDAMAHEKAKEAKPEPQPEPDAAASKAMPDSAGFRADDILAGLDQLLSPLVRKELDKALQPVIEAANKPPIEIAAAPQAPVGQVPYAKVVREVELKALIHGLKGDVGKVRIKLWDAHSMAPAIDPFYVVDTHNMAMFATAIERGTNVWLVGPGGSGKTSMPEQWCAITGRPFVKIGFTRQAEVGEMVGNPGLKAGETLWEDGSLIAAMRRPGTVILLDELTLAPAGVQGIIQGVADDHRTYTVHSTGEVVKAAPGVVFVVADNTAGYGDETGQYAGTHQSNAALINRFKRMIRIDYMSEAQEARALANHTKAPLPACEFLAGFMARARKLPAMENVVLSLRQMTGLVQCVQDGFAAKDALQVTLLNRLPSTERAALEALATLQWANEFDRLVRGIAKDEPAKPQGNTDTAAGRAFDDEVSASLNR